MGPSLVAETTVMMPPIDTTARIVFTTVSESADAAPAVPWMRSVESPDTAAAKLHARATSALIR